MSGAGAGNREGGMGDPTGSAEVRTGMHSGRGSAEEYAGLGFAATETGSSAGVRDRVVDRARTVRDSAGELAGTVRERAGTLGARAGEAASGARQRLGAVSERTNRVLEERGLLDRLRENPLPALAVAFGIGFLVAGGRRSSDTPASRVRGELRDAVMAGLAAGAAQATRGFLQSAGGTDGVLNGLLGNRGGEGTRAPAARSGNRGRMSGGLAGEGVGDRFGSADEL